MSDTDADELKLPELPPGTLPPVGIPGQFLRRVRDEDTSSRHGSRASSLVGRRRRQKWDDGIGPGGPISQSAIFPSRQSQSEQSSAAVRKDSRARSPASANLLSPGSAHRRPHPARDPEKDDAEQSTASPESERERVEVYDEGDNIILEDEAGEVLAVEPSPPDEQSETVTSPEIKLKRVTSPSGWTYDALKKRFGTWRDVEIQKRKEKKMNERKHEPARAYQFGNTVSLSSLIWLLTSTNVV